MTQTPDDVPEQSEQLDQLQPEDTLIDRGVDDVLDEGYSPPEKWSAAERFGNTAEEQAEGETLDQRLAQEQPEQSDEVNDDYLDDGEVGTELAGHRQRIARETSSDDVMVFAQHAVDRAKHAGLVVHDQDARLSHDPCACGCDTACGMTTWT